MSDPKTQFLTNDALTRKRWAKDLFAIMLPDVEFNELMGTDSNAIVQVRTELAKGEGDQIKFGIRLPLQGEGIVGNETVEGNEEKLRFRDFKMTIEELNHAVDTGGKMEEQRVPYNLLQEGKNGLQDWWAQKLSNYLINVLSGNSAYRINSKVFANTINEPDTDHHLKVNSVAEASMTSADTIDLTFLDQLKQRAELPTNGAFKVRPLMRNGKKYYQVVMHNYVFDQLRQNTNIGQWGDLLRAAGKLAIPNVEIEYNGLLIRRSERCPRIAGTSTDGAGVYRTLLLGCQSAVWSWGGAGESKSTVMSFVPYTRDAQRFMMVRGGGIFGCDKVRFEDKDYGVIAGSSWAAPIGS